MQRWPGIEVIGSEHRREIESENTDFRVFGIYVIVKNMDVSDIS